MLHSMVLNQSLINTNDGARYLHMIDQSICWHCDKWSRWVSYLHKLYTRPYYQSELNADPLRSKTSHQRKGSLTSWTSLNGHFNNTNSVTAKSLSISLDLNTVQINVQRITSIAVQTQRVKTYGVALLVSAKLDSLETDSTVLVNHFRSFFRKKVLEKNIHHMFSYNSKS
jgi:hypothetical protein